MKRILCIDGGGIRGLIPALVLAEIERRTGRRIAQCFDLIAGTSTGGILALGLARDNGFGKPLYAAAELASIYRDRGGDIFDRPLWKQLTSVAGLAGERYAQQGLEAVLQEYFGEAPLDQSVTLTLLTSYDIHAREPVFFKSWKPEHGCIPMKMVARATSAAPTYFEPAVVEVDGTPRPLVDGGVFINTPSVSAYAEARRIYPGEEFFMVSLGTGELTERFAYAQARNWGKVGWLVPLLSCMFDGMADAANYQMGMFLGENYVRLQTRLDTASDDLDLATPGNIADLAREAELLIASHDRELDAVCRELMPS